MANPDRLTGLDSSFLHLERDYAGPNEDPFHPGSRRALGAAFSPDGVHWTPVDGPVTYATCDGMTHILHEPEKGRFAPLLRSLRVAVCLVPDTALLGAAHYGLQLAADAP